MNLNDKVMPTLFAVGLLLLACGGIVGVAAIFRRAMDSSASSDSILVHRVFGEANISTRKGQVRPGGVMLPVSGPRIINGKQKIQVVYYGKQQPGEAQSNIKFWVCTSAISRYAIPEVLPVSKWKEIQGFEETSKLASAAKEAADFQHNGGAGMDYLYMSYNLRQWGRYDENGTSRPY